MSRSNSHIKDIFSRSESPSQEDLLAYAEGRLSEDKARMLEIALVDDPFLTDALEGIESVGNNAFSEMMLDLDARMETRLNQDEGEEGGKEIPFRSEPVPTPKRKKPIWRWTSIAASVAMLVMTGVFFFGNGGGGVMDHIEAPSFSVDRGSQNDHGDQLLSEYDRAGLLFEEERYSEALEIFKGLSGSSAKLMTGHTYFQMKEYKGAEDCFQQVMQLADFNLQDGEYHLALAMIQNGKKDQGLNLLKDISKNKRHAYIDQAKEALKDLK